MDTNAQEKPLDRTTTAALPTIAPNRRTRVVILTDAKNEADDQYAIAHAILSPSLDVRGVVAQHFVRPGSMERSLEEARRVVGLLGASDAVPVVPGSQGPLGASGEGGHADATGVRLSPGAELLLRESRVNDPRPLYVLGFGPLTEMAEALRQDPSLADRVTLVWVGGAGYPDGGREANLTHDLVAAQEVFASGVALWQIPSNAYRRMAVPLSVLASRVAPAGELGAYLYRELVEFSEQNMAEKPWIMPECWCLGDNSAVGVMLCPQLERATERPRPRIADDGSYLTPDPGAVPVRVYEDLNDRFIIDDLLCKLERFAAGQGRAA